ncbi:YajG family lipoprotein [Azospirillum canadense]|uniref:hypothetical protein n=1 Tax=Azospirillum canadense TaxID=403962 RepID=UPI002226F932|nr:hypothetical protein [Azospirillum canadense]MCW2237860.1 hypothetical protein [Azospirillum canadense]
MPLAYNAATTVEKPAAAAQAIELTGVTDARKYTGTRLGAVRGGYGNPAITIETTEPVQAIVRKAFSDGLAARGMLATTSAAPYGLDIKVERLDCSQLVRQEAHARFQLTLVDKATGQVVYDKTVENNRTGMARYSETENVNWVDELRAMTNDSLQASVDQALDNPLLHSVAARPAGTPPARR